MHMYTVYAHTSSFIISYVTEDVMCTAMHIANYAAVSKGRNSLGRVHSLVTVGARQSGNHSGVPARSGLRGKCRFFCSSAQKAIRTIDQALCRICSEFAGAFNAGMAWLFLALWTVVEKEARWLRFRTSPG